MNTVTREDIIQIIKKMDVDNLPESFAYGIPLKEQGVDSLDMMSLYFALEEQFGVTLSDENLTHGEWETIDDIVRNVRALI